MPASFSAIQQVGILNLDRIVPQGTLEFGSDQLFKDLSLTVRPVQDNSPYTVTVYFDGQQAETHTYAGPASRTVSQMTYPDYVFPANVGTNGPPRYNTLGYEPLGLPITVTIISLTADARAFEVYATFSVYEESKFSKSLNP